MTPAEKRSKAAAYARQWRKNNAERNRAFQAAYRKANPERMRAIERKKHYGMADEEFRKRWEDQNGLCASCQGQLIDGGKCSSCVSVDHSHTTGEVRALLCSRCNMTAGASGDDAERLRMVAEYLDRH